MATMAKIYTLEITAEELESHSTSMQNSAIDHRLAKLTAQARADREADDLRLPWRVEGPDALRNGIALRDAAGQCVGCCSTDRVKRIASAAPELLEAVNACQRLIAGARQTLLANCHPLSEPMNAVERALRKVATGVPEES